MSDSNAGTSVRADVPGIETRAVRDYGPWHGGAIAVCPVGEQNIMGGTMAWSQSAM
jgi:hypothetical protein